MKGELHCHCQPWVLLTGAAVLLAGLAGCVGDASKAPESEVAPVAEKPVKPTVKTVIKVVEKVVRVARDPIDPALLAKQPEPACDIAGAASNSKTAGTKMAVETDPNLVEIARLQLQRDCYKEAAQSARMRLEKLQAAVK